MVRCVIAGVHEAAQNSDRLHFGLSNPDIADIRVIWPDGANTELNIVTGDQV